MELAEVGELLVLLRANRSEGMITLWKRRRKTIGISLALTGKLSAAIAIRQAIMRYAPEKAREKVTKISAVEPSNCSLRLNWS